MSKLEDQLRNDPELQLPEPSTLMSARSYRSKVVVPLVKRLKSMLKTVMAQCYEAWDSYHRLNVTNGKLYRENERLSKANERLSDENQRLREENREYGVLRKVLGRERLNSLVEQARQERREKQKRKQGLER